MTIDTYTVTGAQIDMVQGKTFNTDENTLLRSIPSVTIDKTGTVSIRGGFAFEAAYEFEGIDYTRPRPICRTRCRISPTSACSTA